MIICNLIWCYCSEGQLARDDNPWSVFCNIYGYKWFLHSEQNTTPVSDYWTRKLLSLIQDLGIQRMRAVGSVFMVQRLAVFLQRRPATNLQLMSGGIFTILHKHWTPCLLIQPGLAIPCPAFVVLSQSRNWCPLHIWSPECHPSDTCFIKPSALVVFGLLLMLSTADWT
jgi:hypothetical protein